MALAGDPWRCIPESPGALRSADVEPEIFVQGVRNLQMDPPPDEKNRFDNEGRQHKVTIAQPFTVAKFDLTFDEWDACATADAGNQYWSDDRCWGRGQRPVTNDDDLFSG
jgi:formylglycine-generating enzyme required for sulfatase activity